MRHCPPSLALVFAALLLGAAMMPAQAQTAVTTNAPLRVGISPIFPPMAFKQGRELAGVEVDLARALGEHLGRPVTFVEVPWLDQLEALSKGRTDIVMSAMSITEARRALAAFTRPYFVVGQMALVRGEDENKYLLGLPQRPEGAIGFMRATTGEFLVQRDFPNAKRREFRSGDDAAQALKRKRIEFFISDSPHVWYLAGRHANDGLTALPATLSQEPLAWAVRRGNDQLLEAANDFIGRALEDGTLRKAFKRWIPIGD